MRRFKRFHKLLRRFTFLRDLLLAATATILACGFTAACHNNAHPDDQSAVYNALSQHDLPSVVVKQDRDKGVIKLSGIVGSADSKNSAQQLAQEAAPGYTIDNQIQVNDTGLMGMANPNAKAPQVEQMAHPPATDNSAPDEQAKSNHRHAPQQ
jgi:hypothetical protein